MTTMANRTAATDTAPWSVRTTHLSVSFHGKGVVDDVSLTFPARGISVLIGRSGCGKTTFLRALNRLNEEFAGCATTGQVELDLGAGAVSVYPGPGNAAGEGTAGQVLDVRVLRRRVGMVFQTPQTFPVSVRRNMTLPLEVVAQCPAAEVEGRMEAALRQADLWDEVKDRLDLAADRLSGGQQQRLCLARVLALQPSLLLVDEPTASLDVHAARHVESLLLGLGERYPVILVSHSLGQGLRLADNMTVLGQGRVVRRFAETDGLTEADVEAMLAEEADGRAQA